MDKTSAFQADNASSILAVRSIMESYPSGKGDGLLNR